MSERFVVDVGAQYLGEPRMAVVGVGTDVEGPYASLLVGAHPDAVDVRLRAGVPYALGGGRELHLAGIAPEGYKPSVALAITETGEAP